MKKKIIILLFVIMICLAVSKIYAKFTSNVSVNVTTTSGDLVCDAVIDPGSYTTSFGVPYVKIRVRNYSNNKITNVPFQYKITISNNTGATGLYKFGTSDASDSNTYLSTIESSTNSFGNSTQQEQVYDVQVITSSYSNQNISYKVNLDCSQISQ